MTDFALFYMNKDIALELLQNNRGIFIKYIAEGFYEVVQRFVFRYHSLFEKLTPVERLESVLEKMSDSDLIKLYYEIAPIVLALYAIQGGYYENETLH